MAERDWQSGTGMQKLGCPPGAVPLSYARAINYSGHAVGDSGGPPFHAFLWELEKACTTSGH